MEETIKARFKAAMKARNTVEKEILRVLLGEIQTEQLRSADPLSEKAIQKLVRKLVKSNEQTLAQTEDESAKEVLREELEILRSLLPKTLGAEEIVAALASVKDAIAGANNAGQATGIAMKHLKQSGAQVEGKAVSAAVRSMRGE